MLRLVLAIAPLHLALLLLVVGAPLAAQSIPDSAFDARTTAELRRLIDESRLAGLPAGPLVNRVRQGAARRVSGDRVITLVRSHADSMRAARSALGTRSSADELDAGASALNAGASHATLKRLRAVRPEGKATTAMIVLADLLWRGVPLRDAADAVASLAARSPDRALLALQGAVAREGTPGTPERLHALVERVAQPGGERPPSVTPPSPRRPPLPDSGKPPGAHASLALSSLSAPGRVTPSAALAEAGWFTPFAGAWAVMPAAALRLDAQGDRWGGGLTVSRHLATGSSTDGRLWLSGEVRSPVAGSRDALPLDTGLETRAQSDRRPPEIAVSGGGELLRQVGRRWTVGGSIGMGHARFSRLETIVEEELRTPARDSLNPRPDTLRPQPVTVTRNVWRALSATTVRGSVMLSRPSFRLEGGVTQRLGDLRQVGDSLTARPRTLVTIGAERTVTPWAALVAQWASHDPSRVAGALSLSDARWRLGFRLVEAPRQQMVLPTAAPSAARNDVTVEVLADSATVTSDGAVKVRVQVVARRARQVQVEGDLTGWTPVSLEPGEDGSFSGDFVVAAAIVRLRIRVDDGRWITPSGAPTQRDEFGDAVAVYVVRGANDRREGTER